MDHRGSRLRRRVAATVGSARVGQQPAASVRQTSSHFFGEITGLSESLNLGDLRRKAIIKKVGERLIASDRLYVYQTRESAYEVLEDALDDEDDEGGLLPCCRGSWIKNERGVDGITCGECGTVHGRSALE